MWNPSTDVLEAAEPRADTGPLVLVVISGPDRGRTLALGGGVQRIGTMDDCALVLSDAAVSRHHLQIEVTSDGVVARDLGSRNGSFYRGARFREVIVAPGAVLCLGQSELRVATQREAIEALLPSEAERFGGLVGGSLAMRQVYAVLERIARSDVPVLIQAETGTGKELCARAIHDAGPRAARPFVVCDLAGMSLSVMEAELFGHVRGAFTGADRDRKGLFAAAEGGTLFLDEVGELDLAMQPRLLRALEEREVRPLGATQTRKVDVRVIAATNRDLLAEVDEGRFRQDLYHRLKVACVGLPPLREHKEDIPAIVAALSAGRAEAVEVPPETLELLAEHDWPGNVRELRNVLEHARSLAPLTDGKRLLHAGLLGLASGAEPRGEGAPPTRYREAKERLLATWERDFISQLLKRCGGNVSRAAREGGIDRAYLHKLIKKFDLP